MLRAEGGGHRAGAEVSDKVAVGGSTGKVMLSGTNLRKGESCTNTWQRARSRDGEHATFSAAAGDRKIPLG